MQIVIDISESLKEMCRWHTDDTGALTDVGINILAKAVKNGTELKQSKWIDEGFYAEGHSEHAYRCSVCDTHYIGYVGEFNYCPTCGAEMVGATDG